MVKWCEFGSLWSFFSYLLYHFIKACFRMTYLLLVRYKIAGNLLKSLGNIINFHRKTAEAFKILKPIQKPHRSHQPISPHSPNPLKTCKIPPHKFQSYQRSTVIRSTTHKLYPLAAESCPIAIGYPASLSITRSAHAITTLSHRVVVGLLKTPKGTTGKAAPIPKWPFFSH